MVRLSNHACSHGQAFYFSRDVRSHKISQLSTIHHTICINALLVCFIRIITSFQSLISRRTSVPWLTTRLADIPASLARSTRPLTQSTALRTNALTLGNEGWTAVAVDAFTSHRALLGGAFFLVPSRVRGLELLREEVHVTLAQFVVATGSAKPGARWNILGVWFFETGKEKYQIFFSKYTSDNENQE